MNTRQIDNLMQTRHFLPGFSPAEMMALLDALWGSPLLTPGHLGSIKDLVVSQVSDSIRLDGLAVRRELDAKALMRRVEALEGWQVTALCGWAAGVWDGEAMDAVTEG